MSKIHLADNEEFWLIELNGIYYIGRHTPAPGGPYIIGGNPVTPSEIAECISTEPQEVTVDYASTIFDNNNVQFAKVVGARPKAVRK